MKNSSKKLSMIVSDIDKQTDNYGKNLKQINFENNKIISEFDKQEINIKNFLEELEEIGNEKEKEGFIKNYSRIKEQIKIVDSILYSDTETDEFKTKDIKELITILETNEKKIFNLDELNIIDLKKLINVCNELENKINNESMEIIEIK